MAFWRRKSRLFANLKVGKPDVDPSKPSHVKGVRQGNSPRGHEKEKGIRDLGAGYSHGNALRSTGIRPKQHNPIDPRMPNLTPP